MNTPVEVAHVAVLSGGTPLRRAKPALDLNKVEIDEEVTLRGGRAT
jgi:hypothetical protein